MWSIQLAFRFLISCRIFPCSLTLNNTSSFLTWSVQLIFSILLQHHISKLSRYFLSAARSVQVSAQYKAMIQMLHFTGFFLIFKSDLLVKRFFFLLNAAFNKKINIIHNKQNSGKKITPQPNSMKSLSTFQSGISPVTLSNSSVL